MKILTFNVRVWTRDIDKTSDWYWKDRMARIKDLIEQENPDVILFQELSFPACCYVPKGYRRVGITASHPIYVKKGIKNRRHRFHFRWDSCEVMWNDELVNIVNVHLHWDAKILERNMKKINALIEKEEARGISTIAGGDWNNEYQRISNLIDCEVFYPYDWTFKNSTTGNTGTIDFFAINMEHRKLALIRPAEVLSDHRPVVLEV